MSNLKFPFKFTHSATTYIFTAHSPENDIVRVSWNNEDGLEQSVEYGLVEVEKYTRPNDCWKIIQEDPTVSILQSEYDSMVDEINLLQELLAEANSKLYGMEGINKPIETYTKEDWLQSIRDEWEFEDGLGNIFQIINWDDSTDTSYPVDAENDCCYMINGKYFNHDIHHGNDDRDIIRRVS
jgi:hypothetical protein